MVTFIIQLYMSKLHTIYRANKGIFEIGFYSRLLKFAQNYDSMYQNRSIFHFYSILHFMMIILIDDKSQMNNNLVQNYFHSSDIMLLT